MSVSLEDVQFDQQGLVPSVVQDSETGEVLMVAYMNQESLLRTLDTGETHFWSRSRGALWHKGETSGNVQHVQRIMLDCDKDAILVQVTQHGAACHTGHRSCFFTEAHRAGDWRPSLGETIASLARVLHRRNMERPEGSYTAQLFEKGLDRIAKKIGEEAAEVIIAAKNHKEDEISWEVADLLFHTLILLEAEGVPMSSVAARLIERKRPGTKEE